MRRLDETPIDPEVEASLDAVDATLAGEPVDPRHADLAELALLLAAERPELRPEFARSLDDRVARRFSSPAPKPRSISKRAWLWAPAGALACAAVAATIVVSAGSSSTPQRTPSSSTSASAAGPGTASGPTGELSLPAPASNQALSTATASSAGAATLQPAPNGRKSIQGAQLALSTAPRRIDTVAQEVFDVVGQQNGIVQSSSVTASSSPGAYAQFQLSVPSSALARTMSSLSTLRYARVSSRTDTTQDVNDEYQRDVRKLADARALRTSLLKQLANATTQAQIDSLTARLHDAEASISSDEATLRQLEHQVNFSQITLTINTPVPVPVSSGSSGFTLHKAAHDAGRVLTVAAGVALIALAALVPVALLGALVWWITIAFRRRRREQALDLV